MNDRTIISIVLLFFQILSLVAYAVTREDMYLVLVQVFLLVILINARK